MIIAYLSMNIFNFEWLDKLLAYLGSLSFSIYLLHLPINSMLDGMFGISQINTVTDFILVFWGKTVVFIAVALLTFNLIEKPFMSLRVKYTSQSKS